jgi:hypothetical protein
MLELTSTLRKNKVNLSDYDFQLDIESRIVLSDFATFDLKVLEEVLYSPLKISLKKLCRNLDRPESEIIPILQKLESLKLFQIQVDTLNVDKERRKYFEFQITRFEENFIPDMEYLQGLLKQVPIHILPSWYAIPRSSNNIFESIVERYLLTPQIYQRYLMELNFADPVMSGIMNDVLSAPDFRISSSDLIAKYNLSRHDFEEIMLMLEFNLVCFVTYSREDDYWHEFITPIHEWREYLLFLHKTTAPLISDTTSLTRTRESNFAFVEDMGAILQEAKKKPFSLERWDSSKELPDPVIRHLAPICHLPIKNQEQMAFTEPYLSKILQKILLLKLGETKNGRLHVLDAALDWLNLNPENRSLHLYRHALNRLICDLPDYLCTDRCLREAEKAIKRSLHGGWVFFDDLIDGAIVSLSDESTVSLKKNGKHWKYTLPQYSDDEKQLIKASIFDFLFECSMVATGKILNRDCLAVTPFGQFFFEE